MTDLLMSVSKVVRNESADRTKGSNVDVDRYDDEDTNQLKKSGSKRAFMLGPKVKFLPHLIRNKGTELMSQAFGQLMHYEHDKCKDVAVKVAADLLALTREQMFDRSRFVVQVSVGQKCGQAVRITSGALWDQDKDTSLTLNFENQHLFAVGMVFGIYLE